MNDDQPIQFSRNYVNEPQPTPLPTIIEDVENPITETTPQVITSTTGPTTIIITAPLIRTGGFNSLDIIFFSVFISLILTGIVLNLIIKD